MKNNNFTKKLLQSLVFLFGLWDFYLIEYGVRPLDLGGFCIAIFLVCTGIKNRGIQISSNEVMVFSNLVAWVVTYSFFGLIDSESNFKIIAGFLMGLILFFSIYILSIPKEIWTKPVDWLISVNILLVFIQLVVYYSSNIVFHPLSIFGLEPRSLGQIYRPCGLALEPATYSVTILMLLSIRRPREAGDDKLFWCAIISILSTFSFWGMVASVVFSVVTMGRFLRFKSYLVFFLVFCLLIMVPNELIPEDIANWIRTRAENLEDDNSARDRYYLFFSQDQNFDFPGACFGSGISNEHSHLGSNGGAFMLRAFGIFGVVFFLVLIYSLDRVQLDISKIVIGALFLTAAPFWNTFIWWFWMAIFLTSNPTIDKLKMKEALPVAR